MGVFHVDTLDLYTARARAVFVKAAAATRSAWPRTSSNGTWAGCCWRVRAGRRSGHRAAQAPVEVTVELTEEERAAALELLRDPDLVERIVADFAEPGWWARRRTVWSATWPRCPASSTRRWPSSSSPPARPGKSALMEAVLAFVPAEERIKFSAMTGQSLFYMGEADLAHKVLAVAEEEGAERAAYALKLLQSEGELSIASTGKDNASGGWSPTRIGSWGRSRSC